MSIPFLSFLIKKDGLLDNPSRPLDVGIHGIFGGEDFHEPLAHRVLPIDPNPIGEVSNLDIVNRHFLTFLVCEVFLPLSGIIITQTG